MAVILRLEQLTARRQEPADFAVRGRRAFM